MNTTFINPNITKTSIGVASDADNHPVELFSNASPAEIELVIRAVYRQVLGNAHIMESERLTVAESQLKLGEIPVREFVRWIAKSELYKSRFIDNCPRYRSHELNFKHLLGRAPDGYAETLYHSQILDSQGYEADIDSYIDSEEYQAAFGDNIVPYYRGYQTQTGKKLLGYTNMFKMLESFSTSDKAGKSGNAPRLVSPLIRNNPGGNAPITDINELLKEVLKPKPQSTTEFIPYISQPEESEEKEKIEREIADLEAQLSELRSFASIGAAGVSKWQSYYSDLEETSHNSSSWKTNHSQTKQERIANLKQQIAQAKSLASLGEARLNKWRGRFF
jgi:phycoerythrin-associated linker protein